MPLRCRFLLLSPLRLVVVFRFDVDLWLEFIVFLLDLFLLLDVLSDSVNLLVVR